MDWTVHRDKFKFVLVKAVACAIKNKEVLVFGGMTSGTFSRMLIRVPMQREATVLTYLPDRVGGDGADLTLARKSFSHIVYIGYPYVYYFDLISRLWDSVNLEKSTCLI
jgi:hypothetical protein